MEVSPLGTPVPQRFFFPPILIYYERWPFFPSLTGPCALPQGLLVMTSDVVFASSFRHQKRNLLDASYNFFRRFRIAFSWIMTISREGSFLMVSFWRPRPEIGPAPGRNGVSLLAFRQADFLLEADPPPRRSASYAYTHLLAAILFAAHCFLAPGDASSGCFQSPVFFPFS